jgi:DNA-binding Lrp family transcriptional regulator
MDPLDFAIYRFLSPGGEARFWAGRRIIDPLVTPGEIAARVGLSASGARVRMRHLAQRGFLKDKSVVPNPSLFEMRVFVADLLVRHSGEVDRILRDLTLVEGVVFTRDVLDEEQRKIQVHFLSESEATAARQIALLGRLSSARRSLVPQPYYIPRCQRAPSELDWRVLLYLRLNPEATFAELAEHLRVSLKRAARSYHELIDSRACWWTHGPNSDEFPLAFVSADLRSPEDRESVDERIVAEAPGWIPVATDGFGLEPAQAANVVSGLAPTDAPTILERFLRKLAGTEGVKRVRRTFPLGSASYPAWFDSRIARQVHPRS